MRERKKKIYDIPFVKEYKYLGVVLNKKLNIKAHLKDIEEKIARYEKMQKILAWK
jgi:hypothetical protein